MYHYVYVFVSTCVSLRVAMYRYVLKRIHSYTYRYNHITGIDIIIFTNPIH